ncbi:MAG: hypothetical protein ACI8XB_002241 [Patiriisocius sp.]|jgi:hypothetical protein
MKPINKLFSWLIKKRTNQIEFFKQYPVGTQEEQLMLLLDKAKDTIWGRKYDYTSIDTVKEYKKRVPIQNYEDYQPILDRIFKGEQNLLWPTEIKCFAKSSGTTAAKSKFIPVSMESLEDCHYKGGKDLLAMYVNSHPDSEIYSGKTLTIGGSSEVNQFNSDAYYGDLSAIIIKNLPFWVQIKRIPNKDISLLDNWEEKVEMMAEYCIDKNVTVISGVPSWTLVILKRVLELSKKDNLYDVWPNLELYMHGGVNFKPYKKEYQRLIPGDKMNYVESYNASEGFFAIQDGHRDDGLLLMLDYGIYYEFLPLENLRKPNAETLELSAVEVGKQYALIISTNAGLWRYLIGDTVVFTSKSPYRINVSGRTKSYINVFGEELMVDNSDQAIQKVCETLDLEVLEYTAGPIYMNEQESGGHEWIVEFKESPQGIHEFTVELDKELKKLNSDYEAKRFNDYNLKLPIVKDVPKGTFYNWMKMKDKLGGQNKVPRLSNDRTHLDSLNEHLVENKVVR